MFNLSDKPSGMASQCIKQIDTGNIVIVIGFGKPIINNKCQPIVKVKIIRPELRKKILLKT